MDKNDIYEAGSRLLVFFREQQKTHGNVGCMCSGCRGDMIKAFEKLIAEGNFSIVKN